MRKIYILLSFFTLCAWTAMAQNLVLNVGSGTGGCGSDPIEIDITADNFTNLTSLNFSVGWDETVVTFNQVTNLNPKLAGGTIFNTEPSTTANGAMAFSWFKGTGETLAANENLLFTLVFNPAGGGTASAVEITDDPTQINYTGEAGSPQPNPQINNGTITINNIATDSDDPEIDNCPADITQTAAVDATSAMVNWTVPTATDDCSTPTLTSTHNPGDDFPIGTTQVTYTATDAAGKTATCSFTVTVEENPNNNTGGNGNDKIEFVAGSPTVACDTDPITVDITTNNFVDINSISFSVNWDATVLTFGQVTNVNPLFSTSGQFNSNNAGALGFNWFSGNDSDLMDGEVLFTIEFMPTNNGNSSAITFSSSPTPISVTRNASSGSAETFNDPDLTNGEVTIDATMDDEDPVISSCPNDIMASATIGNSTTTVDWIAPNANDNCSLVSFTSTHEPGDEFPIGTTTVTYTATDAANNTAICEFEVTVMEEETDDLLIRASTEEFDCPTGEITVDITAENFVNISSLSFSVNWNPAVITFDRIINLNSTLDLQEDDFNTAAEEVINGRMGMNWFSFRDENLLDNAILFSIVFMPGNGNATSTDITFSNNPTQIGATTNNGNDQLTPLFATGRVTFSPTDDTPPVIMNCPFPNGAEVATDLDNCEATLSWTAPTATDECGTATITSNIMPGATFPVGQTVVTYTATDEANNTAECSFTVTVTDEQPPTFTSFPDNIIAITPMNSCTVNVTWTAPTAEDNCGNVTIENLTNITSGSEFAVGVNTITYRITDDAGNSVDRVLTITVQDEEPPMFTSFPNDIVTAAAINSCMTTVTWVAPTAEDNCGNVTIENLTNRQPNSPFMVGVSTVPYRITDESGNSVDSVLTITVRDAQAPTITCPANVSTEVEGEMSSVVVNGIAPSGISDNCAVDSVLYRSAGATMLMGEDDASGRMFNIGTTTVTYIVVDESGNRDSCDFDIVVMDNDVLDIECPSDMIIAMDSGACDTIINDINVIINSPSINNIQSVSWELRGATEGASMDSGINDASGQQFNIGTTTIIYTVTTNDNLIETCNFRITVRDNIAPVFTEPCPANQIINNDEGRCGALVIFNLPDASDNCSVEVTSEPASGDFFHVGSTTVLVTATDSDGNTATCDFLVRVNDTEMPTIDCPDDVMIVSDTAVMVDGINPQFSDNCTGAVLNYSLTGATTGTGSGSAAGETFRIGQTTVTYGVTDGAGNLEFCSFRITIGEEEADIPPVEITCPNDTTVNNTAEMCGAIIDDLAPTFNEGAIVTDVTYMLTGATEFMSDSDDDDADSDGDASGNEFNVGVTTVTYIATDTLGRMDTCAFTVTVMDTEAPVYNFIADTTIAVDNDCIAVFDWSDLVSVTDNCSTDSLTLTSSHQSGSDFPLGTTEVVLTATDRAGNADTCRFNVIVVDNTAPMTSTCPPDITQSSEIGTCGATVAWIVPTFTDNCTPTADLAITASHTPNSVFPVGITTVIYTATDLAGNVDTCQFEVQVTDDEAPLFTSCPNNVTIAAGANCEATHSWEVPMATDNCEVISVQSTHSPGAIFPLGTTEVIYSASDANGNTMVCSFVVTVEDVAAPVFACPAELRVRVDGTVISDPDGILTEIESEECTAVTLSFNSPLVAEDECDGSIIIARSDDTGLSSGDVFPVGTTTLMFTATDFSGNTASCDLNIVVEGFAPLQVAVNNSTPCAGEDVKFVAEDIEGGIYQWILPNDSTVSGANLDLDSVLVEQSGIYTIEVIDANGCLYQGTFDLVVAPQPDLTISAGDMLCAQEMGTLELMVTDASSSDTLSFIWTGPNDFSSTEQNPNIENATTDNSGTYTVMATNRAGCTATASIEITVADRPENLTLVSATQNEGACVGEEIRLTGTNFNSDAVTYHWIGSTDDDDDDTDGLMDVDSFINIATPTAAGIYTYQYYVTVGSCVSDTASVTIVVQEQPSVAITVDGETACLSGDSDITLQTTSTGEAVETWSWIGPNFISDEQSPTLTDVTAANSGTYILTATTNNGCSVTDTLELMLSNQTDAAEITASVEANCLGNFFQLSVPEYEGEDVTYQWSVDIGGGLPEDSDAASITVMPTVVGNFNYVLTVVVNGCPSPATEISITTEAEPQVNLSMIPTDLNCIDGTTNIVLTDVNDNDGTYQWTTPSGIVLDGNNATINNVTSADAGTYTLTLTTAAGCTTTESVTISITDALATPQIVADVDLPCAGDNVELSVANPEEDATYAWTGPGNYSSNEISPELNSFGDQFVGEYFVTVTKNGCTSATSAAYSLQILDTPDLEDDEFEAIVETPVTVDVLENDLLIGDAEISVGVISSTFNGKLANNQDGTFTYTPAQGTRGFDQFVYQICYTDCQDNCEIATVSIETKFAADECVPFNIISPNGDGQNDEFVISCVDGNNFPNNSLVIVNQWGDEVFRAAPYRNNWRGTHEGDSLPDGTYYYIFIPETGRDAQTGFITIQR